MSVTKNDTQLLAHSPLGASKSDIWMNCPGSVALSKDVPERTSAAAEEGTLAHEVAAAILEGKDPGPVDPDMLENVMIYVDRVKDQAAEFPDEAPIVLIEKKFHLKEIHPLLYGTADAVIYYPKRKLLRVKDLKFGRGVLVDVEDNPQLKYYAIGAMLSIGKPCVDVEIEIVQPRAYHVDGTTRTWRTTAVDLFEFGGELQERARATEDPNAPLNPGDHCRWCPAKALCPALAKQANALEKEEFREGLSYDPRKLGETLAKLEAVEAWIEGVRSFAYSEALRGNPIPGWKLVDTIARRKWTDENQAIARLNQIANVSVRPDCFEAPKFKSVAQVEKVLGKLIFREMENVVVSVSSGTTLVRDTDRRQPVSPAVALFDDVSMETKEGNLSNG